MASNTGTQTQIRQELQDLADNEVRREVEAAIDESEQQADNWGRVDAFITWLRTKVGT